MRSRRRGFSLFEMIILIAVSGIILTITTQWLCQTMVYSASIRNRQRYHQTLNRLSTTLRQDLRQSGSLAISDETLILSGGQIEYEITPESIQRRARRPDQKIHRETYRLLPTAKASWVPEDRAERVTLLVGRPSPHAAEMLVDLHVHSGPVRELPEVSPAEDKP